jgi:hypothetical protein
LAPRPLAHVLVHTARWRKHLRDLAVFLEHLPFISQREGDPSFDEFARDVNSLFQLASPASLAQAGITLALADLVRDPDQQLDEIPTTLRDLMAAAPGAYFTPGDKDMLVPARLRSDAQSFVVDTLRIYANIADAYAQEEHDFALSLGNLKKAAWVEVHGIRLQVQTVLRFRERYAQLAGRDPLASLDATASAKKWLLLARAMQPPPGPFRDAVTEADALIQEVTALEQARAAAAGEWLTAQAPATMPLPDLRARAAALETFADGTANDWDDFRSKTGPLTKSTFTAYERRAAKVAEGLASLMAPFRAPTPPLVTLPNPTTAAEEGQLAAQVSPLVERLWRASEQVATKLEDVQDELSTLREEYDAKTLASAPGIEQHLAHVAALWTVPAYEDEGADDPPRPKWRLATEDAPNAERSWAAFGGRRPGFEDTWLAATVFNKTNREQAVRAERKRLEPIVRAEAERERYYELWELSQQ